MSTTETAPTLSIPVKGSTFAYRRIGKPNAANTPLIIHNFFLGNMDFWDPLFVNHLAQDREVILFDNAGVGRSTGTVPTTFTGWAEDMIAFIEALSFKQIDLLGFSISVCPALEAAEIAPHLIRKLVLIGGHASVPAISDPPPVGIVWPRESMGLEALGTYMTAYTPETVRNVVKETCFFNTQAGRTAANEYFERLQARQVPGEPLNLNFLPMEPSGNRQLACSIATNTAFEGNSFDRMKELKMPVLIIHGREDVIVPPSRAWEFVTQIVNAQLEILPMCGHAVPFEYPIKCADTVRRFLAGNE